VLSVVRVVTAEEGEAVDINRLRDKTAEVGKVCLVKDVLTEASTSTSRNNSAKTFQDVLETLC
jgi:DNA-binding IscR family transcriptional regulator